MADVVFKTSGSTGAAKTVVRSEASLLADARNLVAAFPEIWAARPPVVASVRPDHMFGALWSVRAPSLAAAPVVRVPHAHATPAVPAAPATSVVLSVEELLDARRRLVPFLFVTTPSFLEKALAHPDFPALRGAFHAIVTSGSPLRPETARMVLSAVGVCPLEIYGSTEAGTVAFRRASEGDLATLVPGVSARPRADGRLEVDSPFAMARPLVMDDLVAFTDPRHFRLLGRSDRRVKILEQYVSLEAVEAALTESPLVAQARVESFGEGVPRLGALVVLSPMGRERLAPARPQADPPVAATLRAFLASRLPAVAVPRRLRFVRELPANAQGKVTAAAARAALAAWCREPVVLDWRASADSLSADLVFPPEMECFRGHFPGVPVLPGVAQLFFVRHFARQVFPDWPEVVTLRRLKFQKIVVPDEHVKLAVARTGEGTFDFSLTGPNGPCASGTVIRSVSP